MLAFCPNQLRTVLDNLLRQALRKREMINI